MCMDGKLVLWAIDSSSTSAFNQKAFLLFGRNLQETTALHNIGKNHLLLLTGGYDSKIHVYTI